MQFQHTNEKDTLGHLLNIGARYEDSKGIAVMLMDGRQKKQLGNAHGGAVFTVADAAFSVASRGRGFISVNVQSSISFLYPGTAGLLKAISASVRFGNTLSIYDIMVYDGTGKEIAKIVMTGYVVRIVSDEELDTV